MTAHHGRVVLLSHGSPDPRHARDVEVLARAAGTRLGVGYDVSTAYLDHHGPTLTERVRTGSDRPVSVVPLLLSDAYHAGFDVPAAVATARLDRPGARVEVGRPVGTDARLVDALTESLRGEDPGRTGVVVAAAGSARSAPREAVAALAVRLATRGWRTTAAGFASGPGPDIAEAVARVGRLVDRVVVIPLLVADGVLADRVRHQAGAADRVTAVLAYTSTLATIVADRVIAADTGEAAAPRRPGP